MDREYNFEGEIESMTIMFKAFASYDLWIQHDFLGVAGSNNNVNVLNQSSLFIGVLKGEAPNVNFMINGHEYSQEYYLLIASTLDGRCV